jgi:hypothetical protein
MTVYEGSALARFRSRLDLREANRAGLQVAMHAIGGAAA